MPASWTIPHIAGFRHRLACCTGLQGRKLGHFDVPPLDRAALCLEMLVVALLLLVAGWFHYHVLAPSLEIDLCWRIEVATDGLAALDPPSELGL